MLPPDSSPVWSSVEFFERIATDRSFRDYYAPRDHARLRNLVWASASEESDFQHLDGIPYEPADDVRVRWMLEWCDVIAGFKKQVDDRLTSSVEFLRQTGTPQLSGKDRAAGEHLEELVIKTSTSPGKTLMELNLAAYDMATQPLAQGS